MNNMEENLKFYYNMLILELCEELSDKKPDENIVDMNVIYKDDLHDSTRDLATLIPVVSTWTFADIGLKPKDIREHYVVMDGLFRYAPKEVKEAIVEHEKIHKKYPCFHDRNDEEMKLVVNALAYMESGNPICAGLSYICPELHKIKDSKTKSSNS